MNEDTSGTLDSGDRYRANLNLVEITGQDGRVLATVNATDIVDVSRVGTGVSIQQRDGSITLLSPLGEEDAITLESTIRSSIRGSRETSAAASPAGDSKLKLVLVVAGVLLAACVLLVLGNALYAYLAPDMIPPWLD